MNAEPVALQQTRDVILDACDRLMARYGFRKMTLGDVAKEAGMSRRTIYHYFESKEDVGLSSIARVVGHVHDELMEIAGSEGFVGDRLRGVLSRRVLGRLERVQAYSHSLDELFEVVRPRYLEMRREFFDRERTLISELLREGTESGVFRLVERQATAEAMMLATNAYIPYSLSPSELGSLNEVSQRLSTMVALLLAAVMVDRDGVMR